MEKLRADSVITGIETSGVTLRNQCHRFQLVIRSLQSWALYGLQVEVLGNLKPFVSLGVVDSVPSESIFIGKTDDYVLGGAGSYPDVIRPLKTGDLILPPNGNRCLWVRVEPNGELPVGNHRITFAVCDSEGKRMGEIGYDLEVLPASLIAAGIKKTNWIHYDCICREHGVEAFSRGFYEVFEEYLRAYTQSGFNMLLTPIFTPPLDTAVGRERMTAQLVGVSVENGKYSFDFSELKRFLEFVLSRGIQYIEFSHLFTQWGGEHCPKIIATVNREKKRIFGWENDSLSGEYIEFLDAFLPELAGFIRTEGIADLCCFHLTDEPDQKHLERYKALRSAVKRHLGDLPTIDALSNIEFYRQGLVDIPVPETPHAEAFLRERVKDMLVYYCCEPAGDYYSNRFLNFPLQRLRVFGLQLYLSGVQGFLHWGFNFWNSGLSYRPIDPYSDSNAGGAFPPGDGFIVYPAEHGVNRSMRSEMMALCFEDYDLLYSLEKKIGRERVTELLKNERVDGFTDYPHSAEWHTAFIEKVKRLL